MKNHKRKNAFGKNALLVFLSLIFSLVLGSRIVKAQCIYVDQASQGVSGLSWDDAVPSITAGINLANDLGYNEIWVARGTYKGKVQLSSNIHLYGGFAGIETKREERDFLKNKTVIDGGNATSALVGANGVLIDGFTIRNGKSQRGGGVFCESLEPDSYTIAILNCTIENNTSRYGGGLYLSNCIPEIRNCIIQNNTSDELGGGIYCSCGEGTIQNNEIIQNISGKDGAGVYGEFWGRDLTFQNNLVYENSATIGSGAGLCLVDSSNPAISNNKVVENVSGTSGAGIYLSNCSPVLTNNTIARNLSQAGNYYDLFCSNALPTITNCIIWCKLSYMESFATRGFPLSEIEVTYSDIFTGTGIIPAFKNGTGNISQPPEFTEDYRLEAGSDCIDAGNPDVTFADRDTTANDMGAYGGPDAGKVGCDYVAPVITLVSDSISVGAGDAQTTIAKFKGIPSLSGEYGEIYCGEILMAELRDDDGFLPKWSIEDSEGAALDPNSEIALVLGENILTVKATDTYGNTAQQNITITVVDVTPPAVTCPENISVEAEGPDGVAVENPAIQAFLEDAVVIDNIDNPVESIINNAPAILPLGDTDVTFTATDKAGNAASCTAVVSVIDTTVPAITCPSNIIVEAEGPEGTSASNTEIQAFLTGAVAEDLVDGLVEVTNDAPSVLGLGDTVVTFTAIDKAGNPASCTATVSVVDKTAPVITCPANIAIEAEGPNGVSADNSAIQDFLKGAVAEDIVDGSMEVANDAPSACGLGDTVVTFMVIDKAGNSVSCTATVSVVDTTAPLITCPAGITVKTLSMKGVAIGDTEIQSFLSSAQANDIADDTITVVNNAPAEFALGATVVTFKAIDQAGNLAECEATVTVEMKCCGDVNLDGKLSLADAQAILNCYLGTGECNDYYDVNGDGNVTLRDAECVLNRYLEKPSCLDNTCGSVSN
ncbi:MAG: HYR domain-containing protein [bacterium]